MNVKRLPVLQFKIPHKGRTYGAQCVFIDIFEIVFCRVPVGIEACAWMIFDDVDCRNTLFYELHMVIGDSSSHLAWEQAAVSAGGCRVPEFGYKIRR